MIAASCYLRRPVLAAASGAVLVGILAAVQARINGELAVRIGDGFVAAAVSFTSGLVILLILSAVLRSGRQGAHALATGIRRHAIPWWMLMAGAAGALNVVTQSLTVGVLGVSLFTVGIVAGQVMCGLLLDRIGFGPRGMIAITGRRLIGGALALGAVLVSLGGTVHTDLPIWLVLMPFAAGVGIAWQQATNGRLSQRVAAPLTATLVNFLVGTTILVIAAVVHATVVGTPLSFPPELWLYFGGAIGVIYIVMSAFLMGFTGVLVFGLAVVFGQLVTSVALDMVWAPAAGQSIAVQVMMVVLSLAAVAIVSAPRGVRGQRLARR